MTIQTLNPDAYISNRRKRRSTPEYFNRGLKKLQHSTSLMDKVSWLEQCIQNYDKCDPQLFQLFLTGLIEMLANIRVRDINFRKQFDLVLELYQRYNRPITELYIAKADYLAADDTESEERQETLKLAISTASTLLEQLLAHRAYASYFTDISQYARSNRILQTCDKIIAQDFKLDEYQCSIDTRIGVNLFTSFNNHARANTCFERAVSALDQYPTSQDVLRNASTSIHYLGRLAEIQKQFPEAIAYYVKAQQYLEQTTNDTGPTAFYHLRLGELLTSMGGFEQAKYHLIESQTAFDRIINNSSGSVQVELALAGLHAAQDKDGRGLETAKDAVNECMIRSLEKRYTRGQLLCLGYLLTLHIRERALSHIPKILWRIMHTSFAAGGELRRNNLMNLIFKLPVLVNFLLYRIRDRSTSTKNDSVTIRCTCPYHMDLAQRE